MPNEPDSVDSGLLLEVKDHVRKSAECETLAEQAEKRGNPARAALHRADAKRHTISAKLKRSVIHPDMRDL
jgi:hypothetical protein